MEHGFTAEAAAPTEALSSQHGDPSGESPNVSSAALAGTDKPAEIPKQKKACAGFCHALLARLKGVDRRFCYLLGMLVSILHPILALWVVTYKDCPLDDLGKPIPNYEPPKACAVDANGEKLDPDCIDPPEAYARVENICYMYLVNEFCLHVTYVLYVKMWTLGGRSVEWWRELTGYAGYFVVEFILNAAPYHVQTFPAFRDAFPFLYHFTWPLYAAFIFGSILLLPLGMYLARTKDQMRRAVIFHLPGVVFFGVDVFNRTVFLPFFETMQHKFAQLQLSTIISFLGELALANFYGSIFLPATHKATILLAEFGYNVSYQKTGMPSADDDDTSTGFLPQESEDAVRVLLELDGPAEDDNLKQSVNHDALEQGLLKEGPRDLPNATDGPAANSRIAGSSDSRFVQRSQAQDNRERTDTKSHQRRTRATEQHTGNSRLGSTASAFSTATRQSKLLAPMVMPVTYIPPSRPHVPIRPDGPDPLEFDKMLCWFSIVWDAWRYLLIRTVLMKASSIYLYLLMVLKDFSFSYWHFGYSFTERRVLIVLEGASSEDRTFVDHLKKFLFKVFQFLIVRPFFLTKFLATTVWRTEVIFGMNEKRQNYNQSVYDEPPKGEEEPRVSFKQAVRHAGGHRPTLSDWASALSTVAQEKGKQTRGFMGSLCSDLWNHLVLNVRRDWRHWKAKDMSRFTHPVEHWKNRLHSSKAGQEKKERDWTEDLEVRYCFANECAIIRHVPSKPQTSKSRSASEILTKADEPHRPSSQSVFRRINAAWLSTVVREIQSLVFNRCWPRLLQKVLSSSTFLLTELYADNSIVSLLPSYQQVSIPSPGFGTAPEARIGGHVATHFPRSAMLARLTKALR